MKKYFTKVLAIMMLACTPFTFVSCTEDMDWTVLLSELIGQFLGGNGTTNSYDCAGYVCSGGVADPNAPSFYFGDKYELTATIPVVTSNIGATATITLPALSLPEGTGKAEMTDIVLSNLAMIASDNAILVDLGDNSGIQGSITVGGKTYEAYTAYLDAVFVSDSALSINRIDLCFGEGLDYCVSFSNVNGNLIPQTKKQ